MKSISFIIGLFLNLNLTFAQGFQNLDFEMATVSPAPSSYTPFDANPPISAASALPYWTVREDGVVCTAVWGAPNALDETSVALVSGGSYPNYPALQGAYGVQLYAFADAPPDYFHNCSISQTGLVPAGTHSIQFLVESPPVAGGAVQATPTLALNGISIGLSVVSTSGNVITMAGDVSEFAGTTANLSIECDGTSGAPPYLDENIFALDAISFSPEAVPEPNTVNLLCFLTLLAVSARVKKSGRRFTKPPSSEPPSAHATGFPPA